MTRTVTIPLVLSLLLAAHPAQALPKWYEASARSRPPSSGHVGQVEFFVTFDRCLTPEVGGCDMYTTVTNNSDEARWIFLPGSTQFRATPALEVLSIESRAPPGGEAWMAELAGVFQTDSSFFRLAAHTTVETKTLFYVVLKARCPRHVSVTFATARELDYSNAFWWPAGGFKTCNQSGTRLNWSAWEFGQTHRSRENSTWFLNLEGLESGTIRAPYCRSMGHPGLWPP